MPGSHFPDLWPSVLPTGGLQACSMSSSPLGRYSIGGKPPSHAYVLEPRSFYYAFIGLSIAELASSIPSSGGGMYHFI